MAQRYLRRRSLAAPDDHADMPLPNSCERITYFCWNDFSTSSSGNASTESLSWMQSTRAPIAASPVEWKTTSRKRPRDVYDRHGSCRHHFRGKADRTDALRQHLLDVAAKSGDGGDTDHDRRIDVRPADPRTDPCLQVTDYCLWALQRCYERCETRFIEALWPKVSLIRDLDDNRVNSYGAYLTRKSPPPTESAIKNRRI